MKHLLLIVMKLRKEIKELRYVKGSEKIVTNKRISLRETNKEIKNRLMYAQSINDFNGLK